MHNKGRWFNFTTKRPILDASVKLAYATLLLHINPGENVYANDQFGLHRQDQPDIGTIYIYIYIYLAASDYASSRQPGLHIYSVGGRCAY